VPVAGLVAGAVLVASLGAAAGWLIKGDQARRAVEGPVAVQGAATPAVQAPAAVVAEQAAPAPSQRTAPRPSPAPAQRAPVVSAAPAVTPLPTRPVAVCATCGRVESVNAVQQQGQGSGLGAVAGGVLGGVLGNQVGKGNGRTAMTVLGAVGGGYAGHEVEKRVRTETAYQVRVRMDDGTLRTVTQKQAPAVGSRVTVEDGRLQALQAEPAPAGQPGVMQTSDRATF
jgi:outer membrane lipoprotein SlyB